MQSFLYESNNNLVATVNSDGIITAISDGTAIITVQNADSSVHSEITVNELKKLEEEEKSFAVFVYLPGCTSCAEFRTVLEQFVEDNNLEVYTISILDTENTSISEVVEYAPSLVLYNKGEMVDYLDSTSDKDKPALTSVDGLNNWLEEYIYFSIN